jgi:hypothetical protein
VFFSQRSIGEPQVFDEMNVITGGTVRFTGAAGRLHVFGRAIGPSTFAGEKRGTICVP